MIADETALRASALRGALDALRLKAEPRSGGRRRPTHDGGYLHRGVRLIQTGAAQREAGIALERPWSLPYPVLVPICGQ
jgi:hypothetical protein